MSIIRSHVLGVVNVKTEAQEDAKGGFVVASKSYHLRVRYGADGTPLEQSMCSNTRRCNKAREFLELTPHPLARFSVSPPELSIKLPFVFSSDGFHVL